MFVLSAFENSKRVSASPKILEAELGETCYPRNSKGPLEKSSGVGVSGGSAL